MDKGRSVIAPGGDDGYAWRSGEELSNWKRISHRRVSSWLLSREILGASHGKPSEWRLAPRLQLRPLRPARSNEVVRCRELSNVVPSLRS